MVEARRKGESRRLKYIPEFKRAVTLVFEPKVCRSKVAIFQPRKPFSATLTLSHLEMGLLVASLNYCCAS
jgi:hypothetical protein